MHHILLHRNKHRRFVTRQHLCQFLLIVFACIGQKQIRPSLMMHIPHLFQQCLQRGNIFRFRFPNQQKNHLPFFWHFGIFSDTMQTRRKPPAGSFLLATGYRVSHNTYFTSGRLAAAADWPTRRVFSSGASGRKATPGYSSSITRDATSMMISPPLPDMTRPIICTCLMS